MSVTGSASDSVAVRDAPAALAGEACLDDEPACAGAVGTGADLGWALAIVSRALRQHANSSLGGLPGGPRGYLVLSAVALGQPRSQLALAQQLGVDKTVMTYLLDELEGALLLTRRPDPSDRRARLVTVTSAGSAALEDFRRRVAEAEDKVLAPLEPHERQTLRELLGRLASSTQAAAQVAGHPCLEETAGSDC